jgi:hypothetical protein
MTPLRRLSACAAALILGGAAAWSQAFAQAPRMAGAEVRDVKGKVVGHIERVISAPDGRPVQVLVRVDRILRTLPVDALTPMNKDFVSVLSRAEIAALPPSE